MINAVTDIQEDTTVEIVINVQPLGDEDVEIRPHSLSVHSYKTPTFCNFCGEMLFGMFKQVYMTSLRYNVDITVLHIRFIWYHNYTFDSNPLYRA